MTITIDSHELGLTDLQAKIIAQAVDKGTALRRELAVAHALSSLDRNQQVSLVNSPPPASSSLR